MTSPSGNNADPKSENTPDPETEHNQGAGIGADSAADRHADSGSRFRFLELRIPPIAIFGVFALAMWLISVYFPVFDIDIPFRPGLTAFLMITAILIGGYSVLLFYREQTTVHPVKPSGTTRLITRGPFKHTRNPMYLALSLVLIGWGIFLSDLLALMLMPAFYYYMTRFQIIPEERALLDLFKDEFGEYTEKTPRWL